MKYECENCGHHWVVTKYDKETEPGVLIMCKNDLATQIISNLQEKNCHDDVWLSNMPDAVELCNNCLHTARIAIKKALPGLA